MAKSVEKEEVGIKREEVVEKALKKILDSMENEVVAPPIEDTLGKIEKALAQAAKVKAPVKQVWHCTECGAAHRQLYGHGGDHYAVDVLDDEFVRPDGTPLSAQDAADMESYGKQRAKSGAGGHAVAANKAVLAKMEQIKAEKGK